MTYYQILGVKRSATQDEIKEAYKKLMKKYHPDVYQGDKTFAEQKAKQINLAYDVLSNPSAKAAYDEQIDPSINYQYTPPKYDSSYNGYQSYYERYAHRYTSNTSSNNNYYYNKANQIHNNFSNTIIKNISKLKLIQRLLIFFLIILVYLTVLLLSFNKFNSMMSGEFNGPLLNENRQYENIIEETPSQSDNDSNNSSNEQYFKDNFDINAYVSDETLYRYYVESGYSSTYTFDEYKKMITDLIYSRIVQ